MSSIFNLFRSSSASDFSLPYARKTADWNIVLWLLVPAWLLIWLWTNPPHGFDLAFEHQFYVNNAWPLHADGRIEFWLHFMPKVISGVLFACVLGALTYLPRQSFSATTKMRRTAISSSRVFTMPWALRSSAWDSSGG